jgi:hypothetical protein
MTPIQILARIHFLSPTAWDGFRVRMRKGRKLLLQGTQDCIYDNAHLFVLFTKIEGALPFDADDRADYSRHDLRIDLLEERPKLQLVLHYTHDRVIPLTCGRIYFASAVREPETLKEIVDRCYALHDDYDYGAHFGVRGPLGVEEIDRLIRADPRFVERAARGARPPEDPKRGT